MIQVKRNLTIFEFNTLNMNFYKLPGLILSAAITLSSTAQDICVTETEYEIIERINTGRAEKGLPALPLCDELMLTANNITKNVIEQTYVVQNAKDYAGYKGETGMIRFSIDSNEPDRFYRTMSTPSQYTEHAKVLFNTDKYASKNWKSMGISMRSGSICILMGTDAGKQREYTVCPMEDLFFPAPALFPMVTAYIPKETTIIAKYKDTNGKIHDYNLITQTFVIDAGTEWRFPLEAENAVEFYIYLSEYQAPIIEQPLQKFTISANHTGDFSITVNYYGSTLAEVKKFVESGGEINKWGTTIQGTVLTRAAQRNDVGIVKYLLSNGADVNSTSEYGETVMDFVYSDEMFDLLMSYKPKLTKTTTDKSNLLHSFANHGVFKGVKYMLDIEGTDINSVDKENGTALYYAVTENHYEIAEYLLKKGAKQNIFSWEHQPIHAAARNQNAEMIQLLIEYGADVNVKSGAGYTPLQLCKTKEGNSPVEMLLKEAGAR